MAHSERSWITGYIWVIADRVLRDLYVRNKKIGYTVGFARCSYGATP